MYRVLQFVAPPVRFLLCLLFRQIRMSKYLILKDLVGIKYFHRTKDKKD